MPQNEQGTRKTSIVGDIIEAEVQADYYFGGPVANASVEVVVTQRPYHYFWRLLRDYPWCYDDRDQSWRGWGGADQIIKRETFRTDADGRAMISFETPADAQQDFEYRIEARVIDASRREVIATDSVRVTRHRYYVHGEPEHYLHRPNDQVSIDFFAEDANRQPIAAEGTVAVTRMQWVEIWIDPTGQEISGRALHEIQQRERIFPPPPPHPDVRPWRLKFHGYETEPVLTTKIQLDAEGKGELTFTPQKEGYYQISWRSDIGRAREGQGLPITAETMVWVATNRTTDLGYRHGWLEILVDKDTVRAGQVAPVMLHAPTNDRYVLFSVEGDDLYSYQIVHLAGTVKLLEVPIDERHVPNVYLCATMAYNGELHRDQKEIIVPPVEQYLNVTVTPDREQYQPGEQGQFTIRVTDHDGKPVAAEVALSVSDEAISYIQQDYAGDPREFFFDGRQYLIVQSGSTFQQKRFVKLVQGENDELIDVRMLSQRDDASASAIAKVEYDANGAGGRGGAIFGGIAHDEMAMRETAMLRRRVSDSTHLGAPMEQMKAAAGQELAPMQDALAPPQSPPPAPTDEPAVQVRSDFRATLLWRPDVITDEDGLATLTLKYGDSLTSWKATARAASRGNQFGIASATTRTKMPLIAGLQAPRFFLVGDTVTVSGVINNNTDEPQLVQPRLDAKGLSIIATLHNDEPIDANTAIEVPANSETRIDWRIAVESPGDGQATLRLTARSERHADAMEKNYPIDEHGIERFIAKSGKVRGNDVTITLEIPAERKIESTTLAVQIAPSMAVTMLDALPYLIDYPYGCTEQTMSRFLPAVITAKTLNDLGVEPDTIMNRLFGGIEQAHAKKTHPKGRKDLTQLDLIAQASLDRLYDFQHADGGWGWWKEGESDHFMTAYVLWGMCLAKDAGLDVRGDVIDRAASWLDQEIVEAQRQYDLQAWLLHALASHHAGARQRKITEAQATAMENLWTNRDRLNAYSRALLALSTHLYGDVDKARTLVANLENGVQRDKRPDASVIIKAQDAHGQDARAAEAVLGAAHWGADRIGWRWSDGPVEATSFALRAILAIDPDNELIEPVTNWLVRNRRGSQWSNTRDTAIAVLALNDFLRVSGELSPELEYELLVNGEPIASRKFSAADALSAPSRFEIDPDLIRDGTNEIRIVRKVGDGPIYFAAEAKFFSLEEPVPASGNEIFVRRDYYKLSPRPTLLKGVMYDRVPLMDGGAVASGERVQVVMTIEAKNDYEYLVFEDLKPAGLEAVAVRSGESLFVKELKQAGVNRTFGDGNRDDADIMAEQAEGDPADYTGRMRWVHHELRDRKVALFIDKLPQGAWEIRYDLRAETPGLFHALPTLGHAMYVPEIRANSSETRMQVK